MDAECFVRVQRCARGLRIFGHQLQVAECGDGGHGEGHQERKPRRPTNFTRHIAHECVDAGAEDVTDDEQQQQPRAHHTLELRGVLGGLLTCDRLRHRASPR